MTILASSKPNSSALKNTVFSERYLPNEKQSIIKRGKGGFNEQISVSYKATALSKDNTSNSTLNEMDSNSLVYNILYTIVSQ